MTFWDLFAPFYDRAEKANTAYAEMLRTIHNLVPQDASVLETAAGTGSISIALSDKAKRILCTDISERMLNVARKKALKLGTENITFKNKSIFDTCEPDNSYDIVIASQVLHLIDEPEKAAEELRRVASDSVITTVALLKGLHGFFIRPTFAIMRLFGFAPKREFDADGYREFLCEVGLTPSRYEIIDGSLPMAVSVWSKNKIIAD
jgi:ubiquinone/menaquinone biosynthesis C-methylase UbiE